MLVNLLHVAGHHERTVHAVAQIGGIDREVEREKLRMRAKRVLLYLQYTGVPAAPLSFGLSLQKVVNEIVFIENRIGALRALRHRRFVLR